MITVNGEPMDAAGRTLADLLQAAGYPADRVAVERNRQVVPRAAYQTTVLQDGDALEIVRFVGGG